MKLYLDCEFNDFKGALISMALVDENGREWYEVVQCENPSPWVAEHVMPILGRGPVSIPMMQSSLSAWLSLYDSVHVVADWPEDIAHFCQALITGPGVRLNTPPLTMEVVRIDATSELPHNALADARGIRAAREPDGGKAVAWEHTMDNTEGIPGNRPQVLLTYSPTNPFGRPGVDYSESFSVTSRALVYADATHYPAVQAVAVPDCPHTHSTPIRPVEGGMLHICHACDRQFTASSQAVAVADGIDLWSFLRGVLREWAAIESQQGQQGYETFIAHIESEACRQEKKLRAMLAEREADGGKAVELPSALVVTAEGSHHDYYAEGWNDCRRKVRELAARDAAHVKDSLTTAQPAVPDGFAVLNVSELRNLTFSFDGRERLEAMLAAAKEAGR